MVGRYPFFVCVNMVKEVAKVGKNTQKGRSYEKKIY